MWDRVSTRATAAAATGDRRQGRGRQAKVEDDGGGLHGSPVARSPREEDASLLLRLGADGMIERWIAAAARAPGLEC
jgi:hypothetical protein